MIKLQELIGSIFSQDFFHKNLKQPIVLQTLKYIHKIRIMNGNLVKCFKHNFKIFMFIKI